MTVACMYGLIPEPLEVRPPIVTLKLVRRVRWLPEFKYTKQTVLANDAAIMDYIASTQPTMFRDIKQHMRKMNKSALTERLRVLRRQEYITRAPTDHGHYCYSIDLVELEERKQKHLSTALAKMVISPQ